MNNERGSLWRKWDLHVHTPCSIAQGYGGDNDTSWEQFINDLEQLPSAFKVLGINDYIFLEGFRKLKAAKEHGRLSNIDLLIPVIELRIDRFAGTEGHLRRVNYHVLFSEKLTADDIEQQFLNGLLTGYQLSPEYADFDLNWSGLLTRENLARLGQSIIQSAPSSKRHEFGTPIFEGFRNLNISLKQIKALLSNPLFVGKFLCAVGKTEWDQMRWNQSIAEKKTVINGVDMVFSASTSPNQWRSAKIALAEAGVNNRLLDCSDAHALSTSTEKDRIGNCFTWIKADTTFDGLRQALNEVEDRIFVGDEPEQFSRVRANKTKYISAIGVTKTVDSNLPEEWFSFSLPLNPGLIAIIGNRGMGKSALTDILAVLGESGAAKYSFLNVRHFCNPKDNKARHFVGTLTWESGKQASRGLDETLPQGLGALVRYVPQNLFEEICNELPGSERSVFSSELNDIIFSHVKREARLNCDSMPKLIELKTIEAQRDLSDLRSSLTQKNKRIADLENDLSPASRKALDQQLAVKQEELRVHDEGRPAIKTQPTIDETAAAELEREGTALEKIEASISEAQELLTSLSVNQDLLERVASKLQRLAATIEEGKKEIDRDLAHFAIDSDAILTIAVNFEPLMHLSAATTTSIVDAQLSLSEEKDNSLFNERLAAQSRISELQARLEGPALEYQQSLDALRKWKVKRETIIGDVGKPDALSFIQDKVERLHVRIPADISAERQVRSQLVREIFRKLEGLAESYRDLYRPVQEFLDRHGWIKDQLKLEFGVSLEVERLEDTFFAHINQGRRGSFQGVEDGRKQLRRMISETDFNDEDQVIAFISKILDNLHVAPGGLLGQLKDKNAALFYDFLFSLAYLQPRYTLNVGGRGLESLSPGERGMLLLVFYLMVDQGDNPLIIDQPEENLDNQSVFSLLVPCIKEVRKRRQIILVTHNPNLAVVCDAEQIVHAYIDKSGKNRATYTSGAIENPNINRKLVDVLEGTWPAFRNRSVKYELFSKLPFNLPLLGEIAASGRLNIPPGDNTEDC